MEREPEIGAPRRADAVIIGAGILGLSLAVNLRRLGLDRVAVLERELAGGGSTGRSAGGIRRQFGSRIEIAMTRASLPFFASLADDPQYQDSFEPVGYAFLAGPAQVDQLRAAWSLQRDEGIAVEWIEQEELAARFPYCATEDLVAATFCGEDGFIDPHYVVAALLRQARASGVALRERSPVDAITVGNGRVRGVVSGGRTVTADIVINVAGAWAGSVGALAGVQLPVTPSPRLKFLTDLHPALPRDMPLVMDLTSGAYVRSDRGRAIVGVRPPRTVTSFDLTADYALLGWMVERASQRFPSLGAARAEQLLTGLYEITPDGLPLVGPVPGVAGFFVAAGFNGHGIMHGPGVARALAELIVRGTTNVLDLERLSPARFASATGGQTEPTIHLL